MIIDPLNRPPFVDPEGLAPFPVMPREFGEAVRALGEALLKEGTPESREQFTQLIDGFSGKRGAPKAPAIRPLLAIPQTDL